jgi:ATP-dependent Clp protease ATP-binding subunit ClpX
VQLTFTDAALNAAARKAIDLKTGARGLRAIMEESMLDVMYELPGEPGIKEVVIDDDTVASGKRPLVVWEQEKASA